MPIRKQFFVLFASALGLQLILYAFYWHFGRYGLEGSPTPFGSLCMLLYLVPIAFAAAEIFDVGGGLATVGAIEMFTPLIVAVLYSAAFAFLIVRRRIHRERSHASNAA
jgi:hypothetical protein